MEKLCIAEIARVVGVAQSTVSRALNKSGYVAPATHKKIMEAVNTLGYRRNRIARNLRTRNSNFVGFIIPDISNEYFSMLVKEVETGLRSEGYALFLCNTDENVETEEFYINSLLDNQVAAIIIAPAGNKLSSALEQAQIPVILVDRNIKNVSIKQKCLICSDNEAGGKNAVQTLYDRGARNILLIGDERHIYGAENRIHAAQKHARLLGVSVYTSFTHVSFSGGYKLVCHLLQTNPAIDGIFCVTDTIALGALRAIIEKGIKVPEKIQIIGFDGINIGSYVNPALTTYKQDVVKMGRTLVSATVNLIDEQQIRAVIKLPVSLVERETTRSLLSSQE